MENKFGFIAIILVWGGLFYFLSQSSLVADFGGSRFLSSALSSFNSASATTANGQKGTIAIFNDQSGTFSETIVHFQKPVDVFEIVASPDNPDLVFASTSYGLFISRDAGLNWYTFSDLEHKIDTTTQIYKILFANKKSYVSVFQGGKGIVYQSSDNFLSLEKIFEIQNEGAYDFDASANNLYLGLSNGKLVLLSLSDNSFRVLTTLNSPITGLKVSYGGLIYLTLKSGGFWVSYDNGQSFTREKFLDNYNGANKISDFLVSAYNDLLVYADTDYGLIRSTDGGSSWQVFKSLSLETPQVSAFGIKVNSAEIFAAANGKIYRSQDNGLDWQMFDPVLGGREISVIIPDAKEIIIGTIR